MTSQELFRKYNVPGPRYTSYPTVPYWETTPSAETWLEHIDRALTESLSKGQGASVYVHIPFCESLCTYCGCNTRITRNHAVASPYIETVLKEWQIYRSRLGTQIPIADLHLGGGTPTFLSPSELKILVEGILGESPSLDGAEFSIEADPRVTNHEHLSVLSQLGFRRLSLGIQDFDPKVQEVVHRIQSVDQVRAVVDTAREFGFTSINFDLIYGLPFQNLQSIKQTIEAVRELRPDRIAFYAYAHVPWIKPSQRRFTEADLPEGDQKRALYELGRKMLEEVGYREVGMDHFALETDSLWKASRNGTLHRNFMGYISKKVSPLIGLGVSAIGDAWTAFAQNEKLLEKYTDLVNSNQLPLLRGHILTSEDLVVRKHILNLMTKFGTAWDGEHNPIQDLSEFRNDGLLDLSSEECRVTEKGRPFLRNICMAFDARLARQAPNTQLFSKTI